MSDVGVDKQWRIPDELWERMEMLLPKPRRSRKGGRPRLDFRRVADGIFYVLRTGCQWKAAPREFGSGSTLHRYFQDWTERGIFLQLWKWSLLEYDDLKGIQWEWQSMDGAMTKSPLGGEKNREKPDRSGQAGRQTVAARRWRRHSDRPGGQRRQRSRHAPRGSHAPERSGAAA
jgi:transposase